MIPLFRTFGVSDLAWGFSEQVPHECSDELKAIALAHYREKVPAEMVVTLETANPDHWKNSRPNMTDDELREAMEDGGLFFDVANAVIRKMDLLGIARCPEIMPADFSYEMVTPSPETAPRHEMLIQHRGPKTRRYYFINCQKVPATEFRAFAASHTEIPGTRQKGSAGSLHREFFECEAKQGE